MVQNNIFLNEKYFFLKKAFTKGNKDLSFRKLLQTQWQLSFFIFWLA